MSVSTVNESEKKRGKSPPLLLHLHKSPMLKINQYQHPCLQGGHVIGRKVHPGTLPPLLSFLMPMVQAHSQCNKGKVPVFQTYSMSVVVVDVEVEAVEEEAVPLGAGKDKAAW